MDTGTHIISGIAIGLVASNIIHTDPQATFFVAIISSIIPDIDVLFKLKSNNSYVLNHRGLSHTLIALPIWALIAPLFCLLFSQSFLSLYILSLFAIIVHIALDVLNPYGTKLFPKRDDYHLNVIYTFDPIFFSLLIIGTVLAFINIYIIFIDILLIFIYLIIRINIHRKIFKKLSICYPNSKIHITSKMNPSKWHVIIENEDSYIVGVYYRELYNIEHINKSPIPDDVYEIIKNNMTYKAFIKKSQCYIYQKNNDEICLIDLKYRKNRFYYFRAYFKINDESVKNSYLGWIFSDEKFNKKLYKGENKK